MREERSHRFRPEDSDDARLAARLDEALRIELDRGHVDVAQLLRNTRQASRRARLQRRALVAVAAVAVGAVPVAYQVLQPPPADHGSSVASGDATAPQRSGPTAAPSPSASEPLGRPKPTGPVPTTTKPGTQQEAPSDGVPAVPPEGGGRVLKGPTDVLYKIPDSVAFDSGDLPVPMVSMDIGGDGHYRNGPTVAGQECAGGIPESRWPVTRRAWSWAEENSNRLDQLTVDQVVTGWNDSRAAFNTMVNGTGSCRFDDWDIVRLTPTRWEAYATSNGLSLGWAVERLASEVIVAVTVYHPEGPAAAAQEASRLLDIAVERARAADLDGH